MKNEIKVILTADLTKLQSALGKAQKALQDFEAKNAAETEKSNKAKERQIGIIEQLNKDAQKLKTSLTQATSKEDIAKFNGELEKTKKRLSELNALGKSSSTPVGLINNLNAEVKKLKVNIAAATDEKDVARLNAELKRTQDELQRINALGKNITAPAVRSFTQLKSSVGAANGSAVAFNRIIQDAPFGLLGVGNNIQQFTEQMAFLKQSTGSTGAALKTFFTSLITPTNLLILGVSALTAGLTAYQMGAFDAADETEDLNKELEDFKNNLDGVTRGQLEGAQSAQKQIQAFELLRLQAENVALSDEKRLLAVQKIKKEYPDFLKGYTDEEILLGKVGNAYEEITKKLNAYATAQALSSIVGENRAKIIALEIQEQKRSLEILKEETELERAKEEDRKRRAFGAAGGAAGSSALSEARSIESKIADLKEKQADSEKTRIELGKENLLISTKISEEIANAGGLIDDQLTSGEKLNRVFDEQIFLVERFGALTEDAKKRLEELFDVKPKKEPFIEVPVEIDESKLEGLESPTTQDIKDPGLIEGLEKQIASFEKLKQVTSDPTMLALYSFQIANLKNQLAELNGEEVKSNLELIADAFGSMGNQISNALGISNRSLRGFVNTLVSATPKIISAIMAQAAAKSKGAAIGVVADKKESLSGGIKLGVKAAEALGPVGLALLPVFIAGALALIGGAFSRIGGGGGGSPSATTGSTFGNRREFGGPVSKGRAYIVGEKRPEMFVPNTNGIIVPQLPSMDYSGASMSAGAMAVDVNIRGVSYGDDILFTVQQAQIRSGIR